MIAIILARKNSKEIKNKNLVLVNNRPLLFWTISACLKSKLIDEVYVSSDSTRILNLSKKYGAKIIHRPQNISKDKSSSEKGWLHAINQIKKEVEFEDVIALQPTSCIRRKGILDEAINYFKKKKYNSMFSGNIIKKPCYWKKHNKKLVANYNFKNRKMRQEEDNLILENGSFFIFNKKGFIKARNRFFGKIGFFNDEAFSAFQIDNKFDLDLVRIITGKNILSNKIKKKFYLEH